MKCGHKTVVDKWVTNAFGTDLNLQSFFGMIKAYKALIQNTEGNMRYGFYRRNFAYCSKRIIVLKQPVFVSIKCRCLLNNYSQQLCWHPITIMEKPLCDFKFMYLCIEINVLGLGNGNTMHFYGTTYCKKMLKNSVKWNEGGSSVSGFILFSLCFNVCHCCFYYRTTWGFPTCLRLRHATISVMYLFFSYRSGHN